MLKLNQPYFMLSKEGIKQKAHDCEQQQEYFKKNDLTMFLFTLWAGKFQYRSLWRSDPALRFNQKYLNLCSEYERKK